MKYLQSDVMWYNDTYPETKGDGIRTGMCTCVLTHVCQNRVKLEMMGEVTCGSLCGPQAGTVPRQESGNKGGNY